MGGFELLLLGGLAGIGALGIALLVATRARHHEGRALEQRVSEELRQGREETARRAGELREGVREQLKDLSESVTKSVDLLGRTQHERLESVVLQMKRLSDSNQESLEKLRDKLSEGVTQLQEGNEKKLEEMRKTVDEKLHGTLEKRLGEAFKLVSERLEAVQKGLGEMKELADGVGDLKRVLTNVKARGTWGEVQLGAILEQILTPAQYAVNVATRPGSGERVEFAVRLPGPDEDAAHCVWLPIDSKFPQEDYLRLMDAIEKADPAAAHEARAALVRAVKTSAQEIRDKYLEPPHTTDFGIMFLPTEGLYAEVLREPGVVEDLQSRCNIVVAGPTTLSAMLNSLRVGFRTLAIEKRSSEVWQVLGAVKTEFGKFGEVLDKVQRQLKTASRTIEQTSRRTRAMTRKLREVEALPASEAAEQLELGEEEPLLEAGDPPPQD
ncbi:MAG: DNA recombination protein RmuC [Myxococcales bacterium]|nr:DNA recombination protein RmuC [Myxococcales bacterium]MDH5567522.1 DNA recombination protein RmuC [Myxococcales bacterium]